MSTIGPQLPHGEDIARGVVKLVALGIALGVLCGGAIVWLVAR